MTEGVKEIEFSGKKIICINFDKAAQESPDGYLQVMEQAKTVISSQPLNSALTLTSVANVHYNAAVLDVLKKYIAFNKPYVKKAAVLGLDDMKRIAYNAISMVSKREIKAFANERDALAWLVAE